MTKSGWRKWIAPVVGLAVASLCLLLIETAAHEALSGDALFFAAIAGLAIGAVAGGALAIWIGQRTIHAWIVAGALAALSLVNVFSFPHPSWFVIAAAVALAAGAWIATRVVIPRIS